MKAPEEAMERWFYTGHYMEDGATPISVCARGKTQAASYGALGWRPVDARGHGAMGHGTRGRDKAGIKAPRTWERER
jgi:hypothetical protein